MPSSRSSCAFKRLPSRSALALALFAAASTSAAFAQAPAPAANPADEVVVTGFRQSVQNAVEVKRRSANVIDVIKADDMASMPDANLAESIQRIPGVSITRDGGEGRSVTVRGLGGDFVRTSLNGFESFSTSTGSTLGVIAGVNRSRGFDFSAFASELFNSVAVNKSQSADMNEGSLGASVDLQTGRPFDKKGFRAAASLTGAYYDNNKTTAPRFAGLISNTWGKFGALLSVAYSTRQMQEDGYSDTSQSDYSDANNGFCGVTVDDPTQAGSQVVNTAIPYVNALSGTGNRPAGQCFSGLPSDPVAYNKINQPNVFLPRNPGLGRFELDQKRLGVTSSFQYRPSDDTKMTLDLVYSQFDQDRQDYALSLASNNRNVNGASALYPLFAGRVDSQIMDANVTSSGQVDYMKLNHVDIKHVAEASHTTTKNYMIGFNVDHNFSDKLSGNFKAGISASKFEQPWDVFISYDAFNKDGYIWDARGDAKTPLINYGYDVTNPANVTFTNAGTGLTPDIRIVQTDVFNNLNTIEGNLKYQIDDGLAIKGGIMVKDFKFKTDQSQRWFPNNGNPCVASDAVGAGGVPGYPVGGCAVGTYTTFNANKFATDFPNLSSLSEVITGWGKDLDMPSGSVSSWVVPNVQAFTSKLDLLCNCVNSYGDFRLTWKNALGTNRHVYERDTAMYGMVEFNEDIIGGLRLRGNAGLRYVKTEVTAFGLLSATQPVTVENSYEDFLPSANIALDISPTLVARAAFAKVMNRPQLDFLSPGGSLNTTFGAQSATIGNPLLEPYRAKNFDLGLEWYPSKGALLGVTLFYKDISSRIQQLSSIEPYSSTGLPLSLLPSGQDGTTLYSVTRYRTTEGGYVRGAEINWQQQLSFLPAPFDGFGTLLNYTYVDSSVLYYLTTGAAGNTAHDQLANVSPNSVNATVYYEKGKFQGRVSVAYRDEYIVALPIKATLQESWGSYSTTNVDASASYQLNSHVKFSFDALNLTNQKGDQWSGPTRRAQRVYSTTGRQFFLGASYTF
jgi:iron complex outermembrane recepter protein